MPATLNSVYQLAQELSVADQLVLANRLFEQLECNDAEGTPEEIEAAWAEEIALRLEEIKRGNADLMAVEEFYKEIDAELETYRQGGNPPISATGT